MKYKLGFFSETNADFAEMKKEGFGGVIFLPKLLTAETADAARKNKLKRFVYIGNLTKSKCDYIESDGIKQGEIGFVSELSAESIINELKALAEEADGFIIPVPCGTGLLWDEKFPKEYAEFCGKDLYDELPLLFDADVESADIRFWYYKRAAEKMFAEYILPVFKHIKAMGKRVCFDFGNTGRGDFGIRKMILPSLFEREKIPTVREENGIRYFVSPNHNKNEKTLFVAALKGIMEMYVWGFPCSKEESRLSVAVCEEMYYRNSLEKCGIKTYFTDDIAFFDMRLGTLKKYDNILLARDCVIDAKKKKKLLNSGIKIDDAGLLKMLDSVNQ